jgi:hypothetical protein
MQFFQTIYLLFAYLFGKIRTQINVIIDENNNYIYYFPSYIYNNDSVLHICQTPEIYDNKIGYDLDNTEIEIVIYKKTISFGYINAINDSYNQGIALRAPTETTVNADNA